MPLDEASKKMVEKFEGKRALALADARKWGIAINAVLEEAGEPALYPDEASASLPAHGVGRRKQYGPTEFFALPLATAVKQILGDFPDGLRDDDLFEHLSSGGFPFPASSPEKARNNLKISLGKSHGIARSPNGYYVISRSKPGKKPVSGGKDDSDDDADEAGTEGPAEKGGQP